MNIIIKACRISITNEFLRLSLVTQVESINGIVGVADATNKVELYSYKSKFVVKKSEISLFENIDF